MSVRLHGETCFVEAGGLRHHVRVYGDERSQPVVMLPGITSPAATMDFVAHRLADGYHVIVPDLRGRGRTDRAPAGAYTLGHYVGDVADLIGALELVSPVVLGHSMGARIAAAHAVRHPTSPRAVILIDPPLSGPGRDPYPMSRDAFLQQLAEARAGTTPEQIRTYFPSFDDREAAVRAEHLATCDDTAVAESHDGFEREDFFPDWDVLPVPALLVRGQESPVVTDAGVRELAERRPDIPIRSVADAGHMVPWDDLEQVLDLTHEFIRSLPTHRE